MGMYTCRDGVRWHLVNALKPTFADLLAPQGRILVGCSLTGAPPRSRVYPAEELAADVAAAGLAVESRYATFDLRPFDPSGDFAVHILTRA